MTTSREHLDELVKLFDNFTTELVQNESIVDGPAQDALNMMEDYILNHVVENDQNDVSYKPDSAYRCPSCHRIQNPPRLERGPWYAKLLPVCHDCNELLDDSDIIGRS